MYDVTNASATGGGLLQPAEIAAASNAGQAA
jgi:hypothetical protein